MKAEVAGRALHVEPGFEPVAEAFDRALRAGGGVGQACAVVVEGRIVVDLWAGTTGDGRSWQETMRSPVFSVSKGVTAICLLMAADRGLLDLDAPVADLWPEFGATVHGERPLLDPATVAAASVPMSSGTPFVGPDMGDVWGTGFMVASARRGMAGPGSFGHDGAGGQLAFAHPGHRLGFGYQTLRPGGVDDDRAEDLCRALRGCL